MASASAARLRTGTFAKDDALPVTIKATVTRRPRHGRRTCRSSVVEMVAWARYANMVLGGWLLVSAFLWPHSAPQFRNSWSVGALCLVVAFLARLVPIVRHCNTALGLWLFFSTIGFTRATGYTLWHNLLVAVAILALSRVPSRPVITPVPDAEQARPSC
jgi:hypothetical protein